MFLQKQQHHGKDTYRYVRSRDANTTCSTHTVNCYWRLQSFNHSQLLLSRWYSVLMRVESPPSAILRWRRCDIVFSVCASSFHVEIGKWEEKKEKKKNKEERILCENMKYVGCRGTTHGEQMLIFPVCVFAHHFPAYECTHRPPDTHFK